MSDLGLPVGRLPRAFVARAAKLEEHLLHGLPHTPSAAARPRATADLKRFVADGNRLAFERYLATRGVTDDAMLAALSVSYLDSRDLAKAPWHRLTALLLSASFLDTCTTEIPGAEGLRRPLYPFLNWADARISVWRGRLDADWESLRGSLIQQLSEKLHRLSYRAFVLEASVLHLRRAACLGTGAGVDTAFDQAARRRIFLRRLYLRYSALTRLMATTLLDWARNTEELLDRLTRDAARIEARILRRPAGRLTEIGGSLSDPHDGGRQVQILRFSSGCRLVYKPRNVEIDVGYQGVLRWLNGQNVHHAMRTLAVVVGDGYGWIEFAQVMPLPGPESGREFYYRHGVHLALLYLLRGTDFHSENIIACGDQPVLVDLETLLHARPKFAFEGTAASPGDQLLLDSVFACGLLPGWADVKLVDVGPDLSGIGAKGGEFYVGTSDVVERANDGTIRVVRARFRMPTHENLAAYGQDLLDPANYVDAIQDGFETAWRILGVNRPTLVDPNGPLAPFFRAKTRHVALPTAVYVALLQRATHPDFLTRSLHRELIFHIIAQRGVTFPSAAGLLRSELDALFCGDVPKFSSFADTLSLFDEHGREVPGILHETAFSTIQSRLAALSEERLHFEMHVVALSMATLRQEGSKGTDAAPAWRTPPNKATNDEVLAEIRDIADWLCDTAIRRDGKIDWLGLAQIDVGKARFSAVGSDLHGTTLSICHAVLPYLFASDMARHSK